MRSDMSKIIVKRPRAYRGCRARKAPRYPRKAVSRRGCVKGDTQNENAPYTESMGRSYREKSLNENLSPLFRYLLKQVGRPWSTVYREICTFVKVRSAVQMHILQHVNQYVRNDLTRDANGYLSAPDGRMPFRAVQVDRYALLYVCPLTRLLRRARPKDFPPPSSSQPSKGVGIQ
jgi:hypothetical protein